MTDDFDSYYGPNSITLTASEYRALIQDNERLGNECVRLSSEAIFLSEKVADLRMEVVIMSSIAHDKGFNEGLDAVMKALHNPFRDVTLDQAVAALRKP